MDTRVFKDAPEVQRLEMILSETLVSFHGTVLAVVVLAMLLLHR